MADENRMIVVGIGASAGGLVPLEELLKELPADSGMAFVVVQHLDPTYRSHMADVIRRHTRMYVVDAMDQMPFEANTIYVPPSDKYMAVEDDRIKLVELTDERIRLPIDFLFRSLAQTKADRAVGIVLSGSGSDGTLGVREIRCAGGMVIAQDPETAQFDGMPRSAIATGMVDFILPPREIPSVLVTFAENAFQAPAVEIPESDDISDKISPILDLVAKQINQDFHNYRKSTVYRRILRRMGIVRIDTLTHYLDFLRERSDEVQELAKDILVSVTSFFRDPEAFEELRETAIRILLREKRDSSPIRVWVAGCATGEEAYSLAMLLLEESALAQVKPPIQIFASDLDQEGLKLARAGIYPESIALDISPERLQRFFTKTDHTYQINKEIRELVTFAVQNLVSDPPFSKLDLISCRNVLIYFEPALQRRVAQLFAFALKPGGYLFLGKSDATGGTSLRDQFEPIATKARVYKRTGAVPPFVPPILSTVNADGRIIPHFGQPRERRHINFADMLNRAFLSRFGASGVITDANGGIVYLVGALRKYLDFPSGASEFNLFDMVGDRPLRRLRPALHRAIHEEKTVTLEHIEFAPGNISCIANITIVPLSRNNEKLAAVLFEQLGEVVPAQPSLPQESEIGEDTSTIKRLESELKLLTDDFHVTVSDYEASAEELKAANEEITSINEELQSTNEELETSKEEIQAANEELITVNNQLGLKVEELNQVNDDLTNFLNASEIATVFLDTKFNIRRFTPSARRLFNFVPMDNGRPLGDISNKLTEDNVLHVCKNVLDSLAPSQHEIQSTDGNWYLMRCIPYRTLSNKIDGVVVTFVDVTDRKKAELELKSLNAALEHRVAERVGSLRLLQAITVAANEADNVEDVLQPALEQTCKYLNWPLGHALIAPDSEHKLVSSGLWWCDEAGKFEEFRRATEGHQFGVGDGYPGRVLESGMPFWASDIGKSLHVARARRAQAEGLKATLLIPVLMKKEVVAALEFFAREVKEPDNHLLEISEQIGIQIGRVFERKRAEVQLQESERLAALGSSTAKIAHEINNPLSNIYAAVQFLEEELTQRKAAADADILRMVSDVKGEMDRLSRLMDDLRTFLATGRQALDLEPVQIMGLTTEVMRVEEPALKQRNIRLIVEIPQGLPAIRVDRNKIKAVLVNLTRNGVEAMPGGGTLTVRAYQAGDQICVEVSDTGEGIPDELNILEQPISTKRQGIGLGLLIVRQITADHSGTVSYVTRRGEGTTFRITLPLGTK
jgi:two-component system CheB/CheR fusion protein